MKAFSQKQARLTKALKIQMCDLLHPWVLLGYSWGVPGLILGFEP